MKRTALFFAMLLAVCVAVSAQERAGRKRENSESNSRPMALTPEREAAVMKFVELNHPELKGLLESLKTTRVKEYEKAIRDIYGASDRLANLKARDLELYELELKNWTLRSRIQLTAARMAMSSSDDTRLQLRELLNEQLEVRAELLRHERRRVQQRLEQVEKNLARLEGDRENQVERQIDLLLRSAETSKAKGKLAGKAAEKRVRKNKKTVSQPAAAKNDQ